MNMLYVAVGLIMILSAFGYGYYSGAKTKTIVGYAILLSLVYGGSVLVAIGGVLSFRVLA